MKKIEYYVLSTILLLSGCSDIYTSSFNSSNVNNWVKDENIILNNEVCIFIDESYSIVTYTDYDYNWLIEDKTVLEYCSNATFKGLKEGRTTIKAETEDGKYDECIVNIINQDIVNKANTYLDKKGSSISYNYSISGEIISLAIQYVELDKFERPIVSFDTYNINVLKEPSIHSS